MAVGLAFSTLLGIYMAFKYNRSRALVWGLLLLGTAIPAGLPGNDGVAGATEERKIHDSCAEEL